ncbi:HD domain-containing protein [Thermogladius sp. 4427co]|uniref:HD domain-containing protein n=1 Tax=Thermogladius sp. 4427co TaxID=3450718 RepID=UPI003F7B3367
MSLGSFSWKEISDPIYGHVYYNREVEERLLGTIQLQRLRYIMQLQTAHLVYPGAVHTRFQHSLGVMHLAGAMAEDILRKLVRFQGREALEGYNLDELVEAARVAGLIHDIGHGPFGHTFEEAVLWRGGVREEVANHERIGFEIYRHTIRGLLEEISRRTGMDNLPRLVGELINYREPGSGLLKLLRKVVKDSFYPADVLDFLRRDSYYAGTSEYGFINYEKLYKNTYPNPEDPSDLVLDRSGIGEFRAYMSARTSMYQHVYYHSVARAFDRILYEILVILDEELGLRSIVNEVAEGRIEDFMLLTDAGLYHVMLKEAVRSSSRLGYLSRTLLIERKPMWKRVGREATVTPFRKGWSVGKVLRLAYDKSIKAKALAGVRSELARLGGLPEEDIWIDIVDITPLPRSIIYSIKGEPKIVLGTCKAVGSRIVLDTPLDLVSEGLPLTIIIRTYVKREKYNLDLEAKFSSLIEDFVDRLAQEVREEPISLEEYTHMKITS